MYYHGVSGVSVSVCMCVCGCAFLYLSHGGFALLNSDHTLLDGPFTNKSGDLQNPRLRGCVGKVLRGCVLLEGIGRVSDKDSSVSSYVTITGRVNGGC